MQNSTPTSNVGTQRYHLTVLAGSLALTVRPPFIIVRASGAPCQDVLRRLGRPQRFHGQRADHLTIPLEPMGHGPMSGLINIHLTYGTGRERHHETVALLDPQDVEAAFRLLAHGVYSYYLRAARRVTPEDLRREGYVAVELSEDAQHWLEERTSSGRWEERITRRKLAQLGPHIERRDAQIIEDLRRSGNSQPAFLIREADGTALSVGYLPNGLGPDHPAGWYAVPVNRGVLGVFEELLPTAFGPAFYDTLIEIARELQVGIDLDGVMRARAKALHAKREQPPSGSSAEP